jgi:hypothetical protein
MLVVITFVGNKHFRLVGIGQRKLDENTSRQKGGSLDSNVTSHSQCHSSSASSA